MRIAICQPTYLPWLGYFGLMDDVDTFAFLDNVQFEKQSWQQRNRIKTPTGLQWLTVPVIFRGRLGQTIQEVEIRDPKFSAKHLKAIELNYRRAPYFEEFFPGLVEILKSVEAGTRLADLTIRLTEWQAGLFGIGTRRLRSSTLEAQGKRSGLLVAICRTLGASEYLSPIGSAEYLLQEMPLFAAAGIQVRFHNYGHPEYPQLFPPFAPYACALDLLFNKGPRAMETIRRGRGTTLTPEQVRLAPALGHPGTMRPTSHTRVGNRAR
ncbi:MAG: WbqC family protein [Terriglobales bacterium]